jgi:hypothetical protein
MKIRILVAFFSLITLLFGFQLPVRAQELICLVTVDANRMETGQVSERQIFNDLQKAITNFMNNQKWTRDEYRNGEQIRCQLNITIRKSPSQNVFEATAQIKSTRPVYNTSYETTLVNFNDQAFNFNYVQGQPMIFNENSFTDNLTQMLAYYAYLVLAVDYDSFSKGGGNPYVEKLFNITNIAASANAGAGWNRTANQVNRYWISENLLSQQFIPFRETIYKYHRLGLDTYLLDPDKSREVIFECMQTIGEVNKLKPSSAFLNIYFDAKYVEIVQMFKDAPTELKRKLRDAVAIVDPVHMNEYNKLSN